MATFIFGHKNPDTDSVCSSIALSYLKNQLGEKTVPKVVGHLNNETKFVLKYFNVSEPQYLNDVKIRIRNINYNKRAVISENNTIYEAYEIMQKESVNVLSIVDNNKKLVGLLSYANLVQYLIEKTNRKLNTDINNIVKLLDAKAITSFDKNINGNLVFLAYEEEKIENIILSNKDILIVGDKDSIIENAIESNVKLIITNAKKVSLDLVKKAEEKKVNIIKSSKNNVEILNLIYLSNSIKSLNICQTPYYIYEDDFYDEFLNMVKKTKHTNYPILNHKNECIGLVSLDLINDYEKQKVILVDHNNFEQSVEGIEEAFILEIIDHHNLSLSTINTNVPINFRSMIVGSTSTIIFKLYEENNVEIPQDIAGLMLSSIISDTLLLTSPSTTKIDIETAEKLSKIAKVNIKDYGYELLKASSSLEGLSIDDQIYQDYKAYTVGKTKIGIAQLITMDFDNIKGDIDKYVLKLDEMSKLNSGVNAIFITDIIKKGSYVIYNSKSEEIIKDAFNLAEIYEGIFIPNIISRKKQIIPSIMEIIE